MKGTRGRRHWTWLMKNTSTRLVFEYWDALRGERSAPERGEIEPGALRHALADTFVLENEPIGPVFRLAGTRLCALLGHELRGRAFTALWPDVESQGDMRRLVQTVMDETAGAVAGSGRRNPDRHADLPGAAAAAAALSRPHPCARARLPVADPGPGMARARHARFDAHDLAADALAGLGVAHASRAATVRTSEIHGPAGRPHLRPEPSVNQNAPRIVRN